ncbi:MAG: dTDP-4-dehydrorhamnose reductase [Dysgonamonadaceae bacterium]|jgi:dTDP-4-dehydrorhamnose reductase|nr:dTDP-4-dehydrorhamnose reductase [Dysgonamonadaceae bacterium]
MVKNILVTGAKGQLGCELNELYAQYPGFNFISTDIDSLDLTKKEDVRRCLDGNRVDYVINCAAYTAVDKAEDDVELCYQINRDAVRNLAEAAAGKAKIIHISTDYVFDGTAGVPYKETVATRPQSVYGKSKEEGERVLMMLAPGSSIIIRTAWLYSPFGNNFVKTMIRLGKERESLNVVNDQAGSPTCAADLAKAILDIIAFCEETQSFAPGIYHYSNEGTTTWFDFTKEIFRLAGIKNCRVNPVPASEYPTKATRPMYSVLDKTKIKKTFALSIPEWDDSLKKCLFNQKIYLNNDKF